MENRGSFKRNFIISIVSMIIQFAQSFVITAYVQRTMGVEAYGYIAVVVGIVNIAGVVTVALTSVCSRYIVVELKSGDYHKSSALFSTICITDWIIAAFCTVFFTIFIFNINTLMNVSPAYSIQVRTLMLVVSIDFVVQLLQVPFLAIYYYEERLHVYYILNIITNCLKIGSAVFIFTVWMPVIWAVYVGAAIANFIALFVYSSHFFANFKYIKLNIRLFSKELLKNVLSSGVWVSVSKLAAILLSTCSTYLVNLYISTYMAGIYGSIAQLQLILSFMTISVVNVYLPEMYKIYASKDMEALSNYTSRSLKTISSLLAIFSGGLVVYGSVFMSLWITSDYLDFKWLIIISTCSLFIAYSAELINQLLITINKTKFPALVSICAGVFNILFALFLVKVCGLGVYGIAIAQLLVGIIRSGLILPLFASKEMGEKRLQFIANQFKSCIPFVITVIVGSVVIHIINVSSWMTLIISCAITGLLSIGLAAIADRDIFEVCFQIIRKQIRR